MHFYVFGDLRGEMLQAEKNKNTQHAGKWCDALAVDELIGDCEKCPACNRPVSMLKWLEPRKIRLTNTNYPDRLTSWLPESIVVSEKVKEICEQESLIGIKSFTPVDVVGVLHMRKSSPTPLKYFSAEVDYILNVRVDVKNTVVFGQKYDWSCELCNPWGTTRDKTVKLALDTSNWKGEDVFKVFSLGVVVSQKFYNLAQKHNFTNFNLVSVDKYQRD